MQALGDFAPGDTRVELFDSAAGPQPINSFPNQTQLVMISGTDATGYDAVGFAEPSVSGGVAPVLMLPVGKSCALANASFTALEGAAATALSDGGYLLAGGVGAGVEIGTRLLTRFRPGANQPEINDTTLVERRVGGSATSVGDRVLIAGGSIGEFGIAQDSFEILDTRSGQVIIQGALCPADAPATCTGRRDHGATVLADGRVLLVGGFSRLREEPQSEDVLSSAVIVDPENGEVEVLSAVLAGCLNQEESCPRSSPQALTLDNGVTLITGGRGSEGMGGTGMAPVATLWWFDLEDQTFVRLRREGNLRPLPFREAVAVPLPGARLAWVGNSATVTVLAIGDDPESLERFDVEIPEFPVLSNVSAVPLPDGRIAVAGADSSGVRRLFAVDVGVPASAEEWDTTVSPTLLLGLERGVIAELGPSDAALRQATVRTSFDAPPATLLPTDNEWLAYDAGEGWEVDNAAATAGRLGQVELPTLRFASFSVTLIASAGVDLVLRDENALSIPIRLGASDAGPPLCNVPWSAGEPFTVERNDNQLLIRSPSAERRCTVPLGGRVALSLTVQSGAALRSLAIARQ